MPAHLRRPGAAIASRRRQPSAARTSTTAEVGPRQPCPCGSGRRYRHCHGAGAETVDVLNRRPFAGLAGEPEWVALREVVPAASFRARLGAEPDRGVTVATVLPLGWPGMVRADGVVFVGLQVPARSGDVSRDLAATLEQALASSPGASIMPTGLPGAGPRLQDLLTDEPIDVTVHDGFDFWLEGAGEVDPEVSASLERANSAIVPTERVAGVEAAYWCRMPERNHLRWVLPYDEEPALDALARLFVSDALTLGEKTRYIGSFRAHGLLVPVWDLAAGVAADDLAEPVARLRDRIGAAVDEGRPLSDAEQRARRALAGRQVTIR